MHNYQPGDVGAVGDAIVFRLGDGQDADWIDDEGDLRPCLSDAAVRPLVVIDPEDRGQVEQLAREFWRAEGVTDWERIEQRDADTMQAALRSLVSPPRPVEPTGLGAVAKDETGEVWVSIPVEGSSTLREWVSEHSRGPWSSIDAVEVLHGGWSE